MTCVILQPSYIPWRGYFHQIYKADLFVFYDDVQYDHHGWRNRNRIKTPRGSEWITIPVLSKGAHSQQIPTCDIRISWDRAWNTAHLTTLRHSYSKAPYFKYCEPLLKKWYETRPEFLADFTIGLTIGLARQLGVVHTQFMRSSSLGCCGAKTDRVLQILKKLGATHYISGPAAKDYLEIDKLEASGITVEWMEYAYPEYPQLYPPFDPQVSIIDLLMMTGPDAPKYIWQ